MPAFSQALLCIKVTNCNALKCARNTFRIDYLHINSYSFMQKHLGFLHIKCLDFMQKGTFKKGLYRYDR